MDKKIVGVNAGKVWQALNEVTEISIVELAEKLNLSVESIGFRFPCFFHSGHQRTDLFVIQPDIL